MTTQPALQVPSDALTKKLLRKAVGGSVSLYSFLELLCIDDIYVFKDEFDKGFDESVWAHYKFPEDDPEEDFHPSGQNFEIRADDPCGVLSFDPGVGDGDYCSLLQRQRTWLPNRRPCVMGRFRLAASAGNFKAEFGFADVSVSLLQDARGCVNVKSTPTAQQGRTDFAVAVYDSDHDNNTDVVVHSRPHTTRGGRSGPSQPALDTDFSMLVSTNEMNEARLWINGALAAQARLGSPTSRYVVQPLAIWFYFENRATTGDRERVRIDYIRAWQERAAIV